MAAAIAAIIPMPDRRYETIQTGSMMLPNTAKAPNAITRILERVVITIKAKKAASETYERAVTSARAQLTEKSRDAMARMNAISER